MNLRLVMWAVGLSFALTICGFGYWQYKANIRLNREIATMSKELEDQKAVQADMLAQVAEYQAAVHELQGRQQVVRNTYVTRVEAIQAGDPDVSVDVLGKGISDATR